MNGVKFDCVVAAGGRGSRHGGTCPKSLLRTSTGQSWLAITVRECLEGGGNRVLVAQNRLEWLDETNHVLDEAGLKNSCEVQCDAGYSSSVLLLGSFRRFLERDVLFIYGHAPRHRSHLRKLRLALANYSVAFTGVRSSSREDPVRIGDVYLEPPVSIDIEQIDIRTLRTWRQIWDAAGEKARVIPTSGPGEFNTRAESLEFESLVLPELSTGESGQA